MVEDVDEVADVDVEDDERCCVEMEQTCVFQGGNRSFTNQVVTNINTPHAFRTASCLFCRWLWHVQYMTFLGCGTGGRNKGVNVIPNTVLRQHPVQNIPPRLEGQ